MKYDFDSIVERRGTGSLKWDYTKDYFGEEDVLSMWVADMDFLAPPEVTDILRKRVEHGVFGYTGKSNLYYESITKWVKKRHDWEIEKEWIKNAPGVVPTLALAVLAFTKPGDRVLVQTPVYFPFYTVIKENEREIIKNPLKLEGSRYEINFEDLETKLKENVKLMILCNPHNPVGRVYTKEELIKIGELCKRYNVIIVSDEIHSDIIYKGHKHIPIASISDYLSKNTITCMAPSKTFNVAGLSASYVIIPDKDKRERYTKFANAMGIDNSNLFGTVALESCYTYGENWLNELLNYLEGNIDFLMNFIEKRIPKIRAIRSEGTYLMWLDCRGIGLDCEALNNLMLKKARVAMNNGITFGKEGECFLRINIGCPRGMLKEGLERIEKAVKEV